MLMNKTFQKAYLIGAVIVWVDIIVASAIILTGTSYLTPMLLVLGGGAFWFIVLIPRAFFWIRPEAHHSLPVKEV